MEIWLYSNKRRVYYNNLILKDTSSIRYYLAS